MHILIQAMFHKCHSQNCRLAECIVMFLGQVAITIKDQYKVMETVVRAFQQRLFHPQSNLDGYIVIELGKIAAKTGVSGGEGVYGGVVMLPVLDTCPVGQQVGG